MNTQRPLTLTLAAVLLGILCILAVIPPPAPPPPLVLYGGYVLSILGLAAAVGLWLHKQWAMWLAIVVAAVQILTGSYGLVVASTAALRIFIVVGILFYAAVLTLVLMPASRRAYA